MGLSPEDRRDWAIDYVKTLLSRDIRDDEHIRRERALRDLLRATAAWSSKFLEADKLMSACGLSRPTYVEYLGVLERYYLCERVEAWTNTDYARVGKRSKSYMCDTGLMAAVLNWRMKITPVSRLHALLLDARSKAAPNESVLWLMNRALGNLESTIVIPNFGTLTTYYPSRRSGSCPRGRRFGIMRA